VITAPILALLIYNLLIFAAAITRGQKSGNQRQLLVLSVLFFFSGIPALIYQIVWQRALFAIYGTNAESVAVVVSAFMLGLGLGSLLGGWLSSRFPQKAILLFAVSELGVALIGLSSLRVFHWAATFTAGANLPATIVFSILLLILPTMLMGATLPLLIQHLVHNLGRVGYPVATLYFANTFGSAVACYLCAIFLLGNFGQAGSVLVAACFNILVASFAFILGGRVKSSLADYQMAAAPVAAGDPGLPLGVAMIVAGITGFIALGFEIAWFRIFALASLDRAPAFALLLSTYLAGIAAGSFISGKLTEREDSAAILRIVGLLIVIAGAASVYLPPLIAFLRWKNIPYLLGSVAFFITTAIVGSVFPLLCRLSVSADGRAGRGVSLIYVSNIIGSTLGSLAIGFVWMNYYGLKQVSLQLGFAAVITGSAVLFYKRGRFERPTLGAMSVAALAFFAIAIAPRFYSNLFERLIFASTADKIAPLAHVVENRNGVIAVTRDGAVYGGGVYDGYFNVDPTNDVNLIIRAFALSAFDPDPKRVLMIGLSSGSWAQVIVNHPQLESLDVVEINPGYLQLIPQYSPVRSLLQNPKLHIYIDDGRRWLNAHPKSRYNAIIMNTSFYWRDHTSDLLSANFAELVRAHLDARGVFYYNTTASRDAMATGLRVFPYGLRVLNFLALSDAPLEVNLDRWMAILKQYKIDDQLVFSPARPNSQATLANFKALADSVNKPPGPSGMELSSSITARLGQRTIITDDNMGREWRDPETP